MWNSRSNISSKGPLSVKLKVYKKAKWTKAMSHETIFSCNLQRKFGWKRYYRLQKDMTCSRIILQTRSVTGGDFSCKMQLVTPLRCKLQEKIASCDSASSLLTNILSHDHFFVYLLANIVTWPFLVYKFTLWLTDMLRSEFLRSFVHSNGGCFAHCIKTRFTTFTSASRPQGPLISFTLQTTDKGPSFETLDLSILRLVFPHSLRRTLHLFHG